MAPSEAIRPANKNARRSGSLGSSFCLRCHRSIADSVSPYDYGASLAVPIVNIT